MFYGAMLGGMARCTSVWLFLPGASLCWDPGCAPGCALAISRTDTGAANPRRGGNEVFEKA